MRFSFIYLKYLTQNIEFDILVREHKIEMDPEWPDKTWKPLFKFPTCKNVCNVAALVLFLLFTHSSSYNKIIIFYSAPLLMSPGIFLGPSGMLLEAVVTERAKLLPPRIPPRKLFP